MLHKNNGNILKHHRHTGMMATVWKVPATCCTATKPLPASVTTWPKARAACWRDWDFGAISTSKSTDGCVAVASRRNLHNTAGERKSCWFEFVIKITVTIIIARETNIHYNVHIFISDASTNILLIVNNNSICAQTNRIFAAPRCQCHQSGCCPETISQLKQACV